MKMLAGLSLGSAVGGENISEMKNANGNVSMAINQKKKKNENRSNEETIKTSIQCHMRKSRKKARS